MVLVFLIMNLMFGGIYDGWIGLRLIFVIMVFGYLFFIGRYIILVDVVKF